MTTASKRYYLGSFKRDIHDKTRAVFCNVLIAPGNTQYLLTKKFCILTLLKARRTARFFRMTLLHAASLWLTPYVGKLSRRSSIFCGKLREVFAWLGCLLASLSFLQRYHTRHVSPAIILNRSFLPCLLRFFSLLSYSFLSP